MERKIVAFVGSYRKQGIIDQAVDAALEPLRAAGWNTEKVYLSDARVEFCVNCRRCAGDDPDKRRGACIHRDDMESLLGKIDAADAIILGSPVNFGTVTALMKRFIERFIAYGNWPWGQNFPRKRISGHTKRALIITASGCPAILARFLMPDSRRVMAQAADMAGARVVGTIRYGMVCGAERQRLDARQLARARAAGARLAARGR